MLAGTFKHIFVFNVNFFSDWPICQFVAEEIPWLPFCQRLDGCCPQVKEWPEGPGFFGGLWHSVVWCGMIRYGMVWFGTRAWLLSKGDLNPIKEHGKQTMTLCSMGK